jgi:predicted dehydrogenase
MPPKPVKVAILGAGAVAQINHIPAYTKLPGAKIVALCDLDVAKAKRVASKFGIDFVTRKHQDVFEMDDVDAVDVCVPNHLHCEMTVEALKHGKHVLCEKPFSRNASEAEKMVQAAKKARKILMCAFNSRFRADSQLLKTYVGNGELGEIFYAKTGWLRHYPDWKREDWKSKAALSGGGVLLDLGVHMLDLALWLIGMPEVESVSASTFRTDPKADVESLAAALLRLENGVTLTLDVSWALLLERDFAYLNLFGKRGAALFNPLRIQKEQDGHLINVTPALESVVNLFKQSYEREIEHFVDCVRNETEPLSPGTDGLKVMRVLDAIYRSAKTGKEVKLDAA